MALANDNLDLGTWSRKSPLTRQQQKNRQKLFSSLQKEYNETHDTDILWYKMYPLLEDAVKSALCKVNGVNNFIEYWDEKVVDALDLLLTRYINKPDYNFRSLATLAYWAAVYASRKPNVIMRDKDISWEVVTQDWMLHEEEHVLNFDYSDESMYCVDDLY